VNATEVIAAVALAVSIGAGVAAIVSLVLQFRESYRRDEEIRLLRDEAGRRDEELALLRQQVAREEQAHLSVSEHRSLDRLPARAATPSSGTSRS
jgi:hypothetical protein